VSHHYSLEPDLQQEQDSEGPSKSALKRESHSLQELGENLAILPDGVLAGMPLPERLRDAIGQLKQIKSRSAARRQRQYIGKLMRDLDAEPIREALHQWQMSQRRLSEQFHEVERWRDLFIEKGEDLLGEFLKHYPETDRQQLRSLVRALGTGTGPRQSTRMGRSLFRFLRDSMQSGGATGSDP